MSIYKSTTIHLGRKSNMLRVEAPGCIVNISARLTDSEGRQVVRVEVSAAGDRYIGDPQWWLEGEAGNWGRALRVVQTDTPTLTMHPLNTVECLEIADLLNNLVNWHANLGGDTDAPCWDEARRLRDTLRAFMPATA
jgi:hypothetical protein